MPTAVLADDERLMRDQLRLRLAEVWPDLQLLAEAKNGAEAVEAVALHRPDVVFLDIRMPGMTGIEAAGEIAQLDGIQPQVVFVTAYDQYAIEAFEKGAIDYVLKPAQADRLLTTVARVQARLAIVPPQGLLASQAAGSPDLATLVAQLKTELAQSSGAPRSFLKYIQATIGQQLRMLPVDEVLFFISDEKYTRVQTLSLEALIRKPIKELLEELNPEQFWQVHRSTLVNVSRIANVVNDERGHKIISMQGHDEKLEVSRSYLHLFKQM
jgi:DNA-binding LytR/AlgR family response regulator